MKDKKNILFNQLIDEFKKSYKRSFEEMINLSEEKDYLFLNNFMADIKINSNFSDNEQVFFINEESLNKYGRDYLKYILSKDSQFNKKFYFYFKSHKPNKIEKEIIKRIIDSLYKDSYLVNLAFKLHQSRQEIINFLYISSVNLGEITIGFYLSSFAIRKIEKKIKRENNIFDIISCLNKGDFQYLKENINLEVDIYIKNRAKRFLYTRSNLYKEWLNSPVNKEKMDILFNTLGMEILFFHMNNSVCITNEIFLRLMNLKGYVR